MENNTDTNIIKSDSFKQTLVKVAVATAAATIAKKFAEVAIDKMFERRQPVAIIETVTE